MNGSNYSQPGNYGYDTNDFETHQANEAYDQHLREVMQLQGENYLEYDNYGQGIDPYAGQYSASNEPQFQYQNTDYNDLQQAAYQDYHLTDADSVHQNISPGEYAPLSQNISPASFSSDGRQFYQESTPENVANIQLDLQIRQQNRTINVNDGSPFQNIENPFANQNTPKHVTANVGTEVPNSVNGIFEMEGSVEPNGPILGGHGYIPAQTMQKAYYELGETPEIKAACLRGFRQQIDIHQEENNFDEHSDAFLLKFLRSRKFDVEAAYSLLEKYYNVRENKPEVFRNLTRKNVKRTMEQGIVGVLPQRDKKGRVIMTFNFSKWNMSLAFHFEKLLRVFVYTLEKLFENEETQINGVVIICNLTQLSVLQTKSLGAPMIDKVLEIFEGNFPFRLNAIHLLNPPWHFKLLWKMVDPLKKIKQKTARRIFIHDGDLSRFQAEFDPEILPKELGGKCPPYDNSLWVKEILEPEQSQQVQNQKAQGLQPPSTPSLRRSPTQTRKVSTMKKLEL
ncbi:retinaldehyde-binding protein 1-like [Rhopilema esculentum]|uniref:retinaldehyde-binding protein 1-like n=1 Tax=Rhopilema esculentum TaxID=499914 RepID=UPI0031D38A6F